jgi:hypothetical protein
VSFLLSRINRRRLYLRADVIFQYGVYKAALGVASNVAPLAVGSKEAGTD